MSKPRIRYVLLACCLLIAEIFIALFVNDKIIRPYLGDFLVVILIYCFLKIFWNAPPLTIAISVLLFSYAVEISQYFNLIRHLGLQHSRLALVIIGKSFHWLDILAYTLGIMTVILIERMRNKRQID